VRELTARIQEIEKRINDLQEMSRYCEEYPKHVLKSNSYHKTADGGADIL
jgi:hypothetical protein